MDPKKDFVLSEPLFPKNKITMDDNKVDPLDPDLPPPPETPSSVPQTGLANAVGDEVEDASSIWSGPSWWSWGPSVVSSHDYAQDVPDVYPRHEDLYDGGYELRDYELRDDDYDILEDRMSQGDYVILVASYNVNE